MSVLDKITMFPLSVDQYFNEAVSKTQIYVHHTAGNPDPYGVVKWWASTPEKVAVAFIIGRTPVANHATWKDGDIVQTYGSAKWGWHLGLTSAHLKAGNPGAKTNTDLNKFSIGIEICNWGQLTVTPKGYTTYVGTTVPEADVQEYDTPFRGYKYYQKYSQAQLETLHDLLGFLCDKYSIPKGYKGDNLFDVDPRALRGEPGIWSHVSVRPDKNDCHPQAELKQVLQSV